MRRGIVTAVLLASPWLVGWIVPRAWRALDMELYVTPPTGVTQTDDVLDPWGRPFQTRVYGVRTSPWLPVSAGTRRGLPPPGRDREMYSLGADVEDDHDDVLVLDPRDPKLVLWQRSGMLSGFLTASLAVCLWMFVWRDRMASVPALAVLIAALAAASAAAAVHAAWLIVAPASAPSAISAFGTALLGGGICGLALARSQALPGPTDGATPGRDGPPPELP